uniref:Putative peptidase n=1 Tax=viral metagenome TaxID=1070528 RepID=A0A6H1ZYG3_9ZZZZ
MFFPILSDLQGVLDHQKTKTPYGDIASIAQWDWGWRVHPIDKINKWHNGIDLPSPQGTPIYAPLEGTISVLGNDSTSGYYMKIGHDFNKDNPEVIETAYVHLRDYPFGGPYGPGIAKGVAVKKGQLIGYIGSTGASTGPHLHFIVRVKPEYQTQVPGRSDSRDIDPLPFLDESLQKKIFGVSLTGIMAISAFGLYWWLSKTR